MKRSKHASRGLVLAALTITFAAGCATNDAASGAGALQDDTPMTQGQAIMQATTQGRAAAGDPVTAPPDQATSPEKIDWIFTSAQEFTGDMSKLVPLAGFILMPQIHMVSGNTSCNPLKAGYVLDTTAKTLSFTNLINSDGLCQRTNSDAEDAIIDAMLATDGYTMSGGNLQLTSKGSVVATLKPK